MCLIWESHLGVTEKVLQGDRTMLIPSPLGRREINPNNKTPEK